MPFYLYRFIEGREIRCAVVKSEKTGHIQALSCLEYMVRRDDIRKTEDKLLCDEKGLPICEYPIFFSFLNNKVKIIHLARLHLHKHLSVIKFMSSHQ